MSMIDPQEWLGLEPIKRPRGGDPPTEPGKPSLKERIEAIAADLIEEAEDIAPEEHGYCWKYSRPLIGNRILAIAAELGEIAEFYRRRAHVIHNSLPDEKKPVTHVELESWADRLAKSEP